MILPFITPHMVFAFVCVVVLLIGYIFSMAVEDNRWFSLVIVLVVAAALVWMIVLYPEEFYLPARAFVEDLIVEVQALFR